MYQSILPFLMLPSIGAMVVFHVNVYCDVQDDIFLYIFVILPTNELIYFIDLENIIKVNQCLKNAK